MLTYIQTQATTVELIGAVEHYIMLWRRDGNIGPSVIVEKSAAELSLRALAGDKEAQAWADGRSV